MFLGRQKELQSLQQYLDSDHYEFGLIYGIRQVGKTALLREIVKKNKGIYFVADQTGMQRNLKNLSLEITQYFKTLPYIFEDFYALFKYLATKYSKTKKKLF